MQYRLALVTAAIALALSPSVADACGMPYGKGTSLQEVMLLVNVPAPVAEPAPEPTLQERLTNTIDAERAALAQSVAEHLVQVANADTPPADPAEKPQS